MVTGVILAAGQGRRMGQSKQVLLLGGKPMIWQVAATTCQVLETVLVITGAYGAEVAQALQTLPVTRIHNTEWQQGQSSSIRKAVAEIPEAVAAVIFLLGDQPLLSATLVKDIIRAYENSQASIVMPRWGKRPGNPVLFDLRVWRSALLELSGDEGARQIIRKNQAAVHYVEVATEQGFFDVDTPADYEIMKKLWTGQQDTIK